MKRHLITVISIVACLLLCSGLLLESHWGQWTNYGSWAASEPNDPNGLIGIQTQNAYLVAHFDTGKVPTDRYWAAVKVRFRGSAVTARAQLELWGRTGRYGDGEYICDVNLPADAYAAPATMGGYYFGNVTDVNNGLVTVIGRQDCNTLHRMGVLVFDRNTFDSIYVIRKKGIGTIYWDACGYY
jgi:hypothetical protein